MCGNGIEVPDGGFYNPLTRPLLRYGMSDSYFYGNAISIDAYFSATEKERIFKAEKQYLYCRHEEGLLMTKLVSKQDYIKMSRYGIRIAASDAPKEQIAVADYVCDGINDEVEIQNAIELLQSTEGGYIYLSRGNFNIDGYTVDSRVTRQVSNRGDQTHGLLFLSLFFEIIVYFIKIICIFAM